MKIRGIDLDINIMEELEPYMDMLPKHKVRGEKLQSCSPFRVEATPSFAVNLQTGAWIDSGAIDESYRKGHFLQLLAFLREETTFDIEGFLIEKYGILWAETTNLKLDMKLVLQEPQPKIYLPEDLKAYRFRHPYLTQRGISEPVQLGFKIGFDKATKAVVIPWLDKAGNIVNMKFRSVSDKRFWYLEEGQPIKQHLYGLNFVIQKQCKTVFITEAEIDALTLRAHGFPALACGGASLSQKQKELILSSPIETVVIASDNDAVGRRFAKQLKDTFLGILDVQEIIFPSEQIKDINDLKPDVLKAVCSSPAPCGLNLDLKLVV